MPCLPAAQAMARDTPTLPSSPPTTSTSGYADEVGKVAKAVKTAKEPKKKAPKCEELKAADTQSLICVRAPNPDRQRGQTAASLPRPTEVPDWCDDRGPDNQFSTNRLLACKYGQLDYEIRVNNKVVGTALLDAWDLVTVRVGDHQISHKQWIAAVNFSGIGEGLYLNGVWGSCSALCNTQSNTWGAQLPLTTTKFLHGEVIHQAQVTQEGKIVDGIFVDTQMEFAHPAAAGVISEVSETLTPIRCDYKAVTGGGFAFQACVFPWFWPTHLVPRSLVREYADHIADAQLSGEPGAPDDAPLHRITNADDIKENRNTACQYAPDPRPNGKQCDEYPFASTREGAYTGGGSWSWRLIDENHNRDGGNLLQRFYQDARILRGDEFYVKVVA